MDPFGLADSETYPQGHVTGEGLSVVRARLMHLHTTYITNSNRYLYVNNNPITQSDPSVLRAITIDDGPHPASTQKLLDAFRRFNLKVGFYVIGRNVNAWEGGMVAIVNAPKRQGIGYHSMTQHHPFCAFQEQEKVNE